MKGETMKRIESVAALQVGTTARTVNVRGLAFLMENNSQAESVYFKEMRDDGMAVTADNGYKLGPGQSLVWPLTARDLSVIATGADTDVRLLILDEI